MEEEEKTNVIMFPGVVMEDTPGTVLNVLTAAVGLSIVQQEYEARVVGCLEDGTAPKLASAAAGLMQKLLAEDPQMYIDLTARLGIVLQDSSEYEDFEDD